MSEHCAPTLVNDTSQRASWRTGIEQWLNRPQVQNTLIALIIVNAIVLGAETSPTLMAGWGDWLKAADKLLLGIFVCEIALRLASRGLRYFRDPWNVFDFTVIAISLIPASGPFAVLRALRVLRVLRLVTLIPSMKRVVGGLLSALPGLGSVCAIIGLIFYVAAVMATKLFGAAFPHWFGDLGASMFTLFQIMTLEGWAMDIVRPVMERYPMAWIFFIVFILASTFTMLNLFIAVIVNAIQQDGVIPGDASIPVELTRLRTEIAAMRTQLASLRLTESTPTGRRE